MYCITEQDKFSKKLTRGVVRYNPNESKPPPSEPPDARLQQHGAMPESVGRGIMQADVSMSGAGGSCGTQALIAACELAHGTLDHDTPQEHLVAMVAFAAQLHATSAVYRRFAWANPLVQYHVLHLGELLGTKVGRPTHVRATAEELTRLFELMQ